MNCQFVRFLTGFLLSFAAFAQVPDANFLTRRDYYMGGFGGGGLYGDFNGDGKIDLVHGNGTPYAEQLECMPGKGDGTFRPPQSSAATDLKESGIVFRAADLNRDGKLDVVFRGDLARIRAFLGKGDCTFLPSVQVTPTENFFYNVTVADLNGDGALDIVSAGATGVAIALGNGDGTFRPAVFYLGMLTYGAAALDLRRNGKPDLIVPALLGTYLLRNNGDGSFGPPAPVLTRTCSLFSDHRLGDFNRDGRLDIAVVCSRISDSDPHSFLAIWLDDGVGGIRESFYLQMGSGSQIDVGDINGDGLLDVAVNARRISLFLGAGDGTLTLLTEWMDTSCCVEWIGLASLRGNGRVDLLARNSYGPFSFSVFLNAGGGVFPNGVKTTTNSGHNFMAKADLNRDGRMDVVVTNSAGARIFLGTGVWQQPFVAGGDVSTGSFPAYGIAIADFNNDQLLDLALGVEGPKVAIFLRSPAGGYVFTGVFRAYPGEESSTYSPYGIVTGDWNKDGKLDVITNFNSILFGQGNGRFGAPILLGEPYEGPSTPETFSPAAADFNLDGHLDVALLTRNRGSTGGEVQVRLGRGNGTFGPAIVCLEAVGAALIPGRFNADPYPDLFLPAGRLFWVLLGNGDGTFRLGQQHPPTYSGGEQDSGILGDFNGDSFTDFALLDSRTGHVTLGLGRGDGTFSGFEAPQGFPLPFGGSGWPVPPGMPTLEQRPFPLMFGTGGSPAAMVSGNFRFGGNPKKQDIVAADGGGALTTLFNIEPGANP